MLPLAPCPTLPHRAHVQVTYGTIDCAGVGATTIADACAALTAKTVSEYPDLIVVSCTGYCGSLILQLQIDTRVPDAAILAAENAVAANPASVAITLVAADSATAALAPSTFVYQGTATTSAPPPAMPATTAMAATTVAAAAEASEVQTVVDTVDVQVDEGAAAAAEASEVQTVVDTVDVRVDEGAAAAAEVSEVQTVVDTVDVQFDGAAAALSTSTEAPAEVSEVQTAVDTVDVQVDEAAAATTAATTTAATTTRPELIAVGQRTTVGTISSTGSTSSSSTYSDVGVVSTTVGSMVANAEDFADCEIKLYAHVEHGTCPPATAQPLDTVWLNSTTGTAEAKCTTKTTAASGVPTDLEMTLKPICKDSPTDAQAWSICS